MTNNPNELTGAQGSVLVDPIFKVISDVPRSHANRAHVVACLSHPDVRAAVDARGRKKLIMASLLTEVCVAQSVLPAIKASTA
jgi:nicotinamidase-related amidase